MQLMKKIFNKCIKHRKEVIAFTRKTLCFKQRPLCKILAETNIVLSKREREMPYNITREELCNSYDYTLAWQNIIVIKILFGHLKYNDTI